MNKRLKKIQPEQLKPRTRSDTRISLDEARHPGVKIEKIIKHTIAQDEKTITYLIKWEEDSKLLNSWETANIFFDFEDRERIWHEYLTDNFSKRKVDKIKTDAVGFSSKKPLKETSSDTLTEDIVLSNQEEEENLDNDNLYPSSPILGETKSDTACSNLDQTMADSEEQ